MADKLCFVCDRKLGFVHEPFNNYTLNEEHRESPKGFKDDSLLCRECVDSLPKIKEEVIQRKEPKKESKQNKKLDMGEKPSAAWYLAPILMGIIGSVIMWYVLKDELSFSNLNEVFDSFKTITTENVRDGIIYD